MRTLAAMIAVACASAALASQPEAQTRWRTVWRVIDGDTIDLDGRERVRLVGVDTPETKHPKKPVEYFGREATEFTRRMVILSRFREVAVTRRRCDRGT